MRRLIVLLCTGILLAATAGPALAAPGGQSADNATMWYLSLGDSLAAGYQPTGDPADMYRTNEGYADQLLVLARSEYPKLKLAKFGCPGETTVTFTQGGICGYDEGSQLAQALVFLKAHKDKVAFVTIDLGWNDFKCDEANPNPGVCIPQGVASIKANLPAILAALQEAAPGIPIVGGTLYDPFLALWFMGGTWMDLALQTPALIHYVNGEEIFIYDQLGMPVADVEGAFHTMDFTLQANGLPLNVSLICAWTWKCSPYQDNHANAAGYHVMAEAFWTALPH